MASTSSNVQAYSLLQVTDPAVRAQLAELAGGQPYVEKAGAFFVVCGDCRRHALVCEGAGEPYETNLETFLVATIDAALFAQNLAVAFEAMGYGMCYIGGLRNNLPVANKLLELPRHVFPYFGFCVGRPADQPDTKPRLPVEAVWFKDSYPADEEMLARVGEYDACMSEYYQRRIGKHRDWSTAIRRMRAQRKREDLADFYRDKGAVLD
jgi:FMN reductase (NADPH)